MFYTVFTVDRIEEYWEPKTDGMDRSVSQCMLHTQLSLALHLHIFATCFVCSDMVGWVSRTAFDLQKISLQQCPKVIFIYILDIQQLTQVHLEIWPLKWKAVWAPSLNDVQILCFYCTVVDIAYYQVARKPM